MNYIKHLNGVFRQFNKDSRLNPTHISLYMALFQYWNINRFPNVFHIHRDEIMQMAKIGSKATYHRCLGELNSLKYILYLPSHNPYKGSRVKMPIFCTSDEQASNKYRTRNEQAVVSITNINKQILKINKRGVPENELEVVSFFNLKKWPLNEGIKFYNYYKCLGWKIQGRAEILDWHPLAEKWMANEAMIKNNKEAPHLDSYRDRDNLKTTKTKEYDRPL